MSQTVELPRTQGPGSGIGGQWRVIVRNDDHNTFEGVAGALSRTLPGVTLDGGFALADDLVEPFRPLVDGLVRRMTDDYPPHRWRRHFIVHVSP